VVLTNLHPVTVQLRREENDEGVVGVLIDLRPLVLVANVLQRQRVKSEGLLQQLVIVVPGVLDVEPEALLSLLEAGEQAIGGRIERRAIGRDNMADRVPRLVALSLGDVGRRGAGPRRLYRLPT
jgi:hypothetical protein